VGELAMIIDRHRLAQPCSLAADRLRASGEWNHATFAQVAKAPPQSHRCRKLANWVGSASQGVVIACAAVFVQRSRASRCEYRLVVKMLIAFSIMLCSRVVVHNAVRVQRMRRCILRNKAVLFNIATQHADR
jgi:hypothetical protein